MAKNEIAKTTGSAQSHGVVARCRVSAVSFLNTVPLVDGVGERDGIELTRDVPAALLGRLRAGQADLVLLPVADLFSAGRELAVLPAGCIASDGPTLTVRVFGRVEPSAIKHLYADTHSHTSVALAGVLWAEQFGARPEIVPYDAAAGPVPASAEAVLLIGDKVVTNPPIDFAWQLDLGGLWRELTGLPFVFAAWAGPIEQAEMLVKAGKTLAKARRRNAGCLDELAERWAPRHDWPIEVARKYLRDHMQYDLTARHRRGMERFLALAGEHGSVPPGGPVRYIEVD